MPASKAPGAGAGVATASPSHSAEALKRRLNHFYSYDGTWRQAEPSWRVKLFQRENVRGAPSEANTMNDPTLLQHLQPGRRAQAAQPPPTAPAGAVIQKSANAAAAEALPDDAFNKAVLGDPEVAARVHFQAPIDDATREKYLEVWQGLKAAQ